MPTSKVKHSLFLTFDIATKCVLHTTILQTDSLNQPKTKIGFFCRKFKQKGDFFVFLYLNVNYKFSKQYKEEPSDDILSYLEWLYKEIWN